MKKLESLKSELFQDNDLMSKLELQSNQGGKEIPTKDDRTGDCDSLLSADNADDALQSREVEGDPFLADSDCGEETGTDVLPDVKGIHNSFSSLDMMISSPSTIRFGI